MPTVQLYIPEKIWANMMRKHGYNKKKVMEEIRAILRAKYGAKRV